MSTKIFVNLPVKNLDRTVSFFTSLGFTFNPQFTDEKGTCMIIGEDIFIMLLVEEFFKTFTQKRISDAKKSTEAILALSAGSRQEVDQMIKKVLEAGGAVPRKPQDDGWMYGCGFEDPDGHLWEILYMTPSAINTK